MLLRTTLRARALRPAYLHAIRLVSTAPIINIDNGTFYKQYPTGDDAASNPPLYPNLNLIIPSNISPAPEEKRIKDQHWAVIGPSEKTDLLNILRGQYISIPPNARSYPYLLSDEIAAKDPRMRFVGNAVQYIGFSGEGSGAIGGTRGAYLSARYESHREETDWTVEQFLRGQTSLNPLEGEEKGILHDEQHMRKVVTDLRLADLLDMPVANLSNGQTRRARIAKALLRKPELLLLDEPFMGLDPATVRSLSKLLHRLAQNHSPRLVLALRPQDTVPEWITHLILVGNSNQVLKQGSRKDVDNTLGVWKYLATRKPTNGLTDDQRIILQDAREQMKSGILDSQLLRDFTATDKYHKKLHGNPYGGEPLIEMEGVRVQYGDKVALGDWQQNVNREKRDGLHWTVRRGQRWAILGPNGSGKTTLVSLITSDHPQTYALPIKFFGRSRLPEAGKPGLSLFELQSRLGHTSPEIHAFFPRQLTVREALESAFAETFLSKPRLTHERDLDVNAVLQVFRSELDPYFTKAGAHKDLGEVKSYNNLFPKLPSSRSAGYYGARLPHDAEVDYADDIRFGQLSISQQRIVLFLRALVHKPDIVILDEPFSGLTASQRDKCLEFLERGQRKPPSRHAAPLRHSGLSEDQALIMISHVKEEIPDWVRHYMRLPSGSSDDPDALDFRFGSLKQSSRLGDPKTWDLAWAPPSEFEKEGQRRRQRKPETMEGGDLQKYEWWTI